ncbi:MAG: dihydrodipicolinate synthase family protein [Candidatus Eremiobacteraeota bacterium]|nr:dihydrodipicolinate synthase family protein [Candidatus Eremiobacteraeota bacterium]
MKGIYAAVLTPVDERFAPDAARALPYYRELLGRGCDGLNLLGTTGEAMSLSVKQRVAFMEAIASSGLPMERMMAGTGAASLDDAATLTATAFGCGFSAALIMPPFFFRDADDDAIFRFYAELFARTNPPRNGVLLYNFPRMSGIAFRPTLVARLVAEFPQAIAGMKDSSNDPELQSEILAAHRDLTMFPGSESDLLSAKRRGCAGCISGSVALWPELAQAGFRDEDETQARQLAQRRAQLDGVPFIPAVRYLTANERSEPQWERAVPPQRGLTAEEGRALRAQVKRG